MRILVDMNLSPRWVGIFEGAGIDAVHWSAVGPPEATDAQIMSHAAAHGQIVLTHDLDFSAILAATQGQKPSVVQVRSHNLNPDELGSWLIAAIRQVAQELDQGALVTIDRSRMRLRVLPLR
jgi:predicted nuclease of predicted toxin-antitoxin system